MRAGSNMGPEGQGSCSPAQIWGPEVKVRGMLSWRGLREKTQTPFIPCRIPTGIPMRVSSSPSSTGVVPLSLDIDSQQNLLLLLTAAALRDSVLCLPTDSHSLLVNKLPRIPPSVSLLAAPGNVARGKQHGQPCDKPHALKPHALMPAL